MSNYEKYMAKLFTKERVKFQSEKTYPDLAKGKFRFDFFLVDYGVLIEIDGEQHFKPIYGRQNFIKGQEHDRRKNSYCLARGIKLYRIPYWDVYKIRTLQDVFKDSYLVKTRWHSDNLTPP